MFPSTGFCYSTDNDLSYLFGAGVSPKNIQQNTQSFEMSAASHNIEKRLAQKYNSNETAVLNYKGEGKTFIYTYKSDDQGSAIKGRREQGVCLGQEFGWSPSYSNGNAPKIALGFWCLKTDMPKATPQDAAEIAKVVYDELGVAQFITTRIETGLDIPLDNFSGFGVHFQQFLGFASAAYHSARELPLNTRYDRSQGRVMVVYRKRW